MNEAWFRNYLRCPQCGGELKIDSVVTCQLCDFQNSSGRDLRPRTPGKGKVRFSLSNISTIQPCEMLQSIDSTPPIVTYTGPNAIRDSRQLMSEVSQQLPNGGKVLDLGCGPRDQFAPLTYLNFSYVGVDYCNAAADLLADAHAIPFEDESFDCIFSYAVLEHLHNPFIALHEISRVLKPGGFFIGTVAQGEPFHDSYFHVTPWGMLSLVSSVPGLRLLKMWDSSDTLCSLASMGRYSRILRVALAGLNFLNAHLPWLAPRKMMWPAKEKQLDSLYRAGSLCFVIVKHRPD